MDSRSGRKARHGEPMTGIRKCATSPFLIPLERVVTTHQKELTYSGSRFELRPYIVSDPAKPRENGTVRLPLRFPHRA